MTDSVVGLPLETARYVLNRDGIEITSIETAQPPENTGHPPPPEKKCDLYVAGQHQVSEALVKLRVVSVPAIEIA